MKIEFESVTVREKTIDPELLFTFRMDEIDPTKLPLSISGELFSEDDYKVGDLTAKADTGYRLKLNAESGGHMEHNHPFSFTLCCQLSQRAIQHIENYRQERNSEMRNVVFKVHLNFNMLEGNLEIAHLHLAGDTSKSDSQLNVYYQYVKHFSAVRTNMWILSANNGSKPFEINRYPYSIIVVDIDLMKWNRHFAGPLGLGKFHVYEFTEPQNMPLETELQKRYAKAITEITEMKKQLQLGEWKQAINASRAVVELFKNFDDFQQLLIDAGYSADAYGELKKSIQSFFNYISKVQHALAMNNRDINETVIVYKEDAYMVYSFCISLLNLVSGKVIRAR